MHSRPPGVDGALKQVPLRLSPSLPLCRHSQGDEPDLNPLPPSLQGQGSGTGRLQREPISPSLFYIKCVQAEILEKEKVIPVPSAKDNISSKFDFEAKNDTCEIFMIPDF